jgi:hypothetical protein
MALNPLRITEAVLQAESAAIEAEAIGWQPLGEGGLHVGKQETEEAVIAATGVPDAGLAGMHWRTAGRFPDYAGTSLDGGGRSFLRCGVSVTAASRRIPQRSGS